MTVLRWGVIGTGGIASAFVHDLSLLPDTVVSAVGSSASMNATTPGSTATGPAAWAAATDSDSAVASSVTSG